MPFVFLPYVPCVVPAGLPHLGGCTGGGGDFPPSGELGGPPRGGSSPSCPPSRPVACPDPGGGDDGDPAARRGARRVAAAEEGLRPGLRGRLPLGGGAAGRVSLELFFRTFQGQCKASMPLCAEGPVPFISPSRGSLPPEFRSANAIVCRGASTIYLTQQGFPSPWISFNQRHYVPKGQYHLSRREGFPSP